MNLRQLQNFIHIVDTGSITRTAHNIGIAQPALTLQIAQMEDELGTQLLLRSSRGVAPTAAGLMLYRQARLVQRQMEQLPHVVRGAGTELAGEVVVGFATALAPMFSSPLAAEVLARYPQVKVRMLEGESALQRELVVHSRVDMAVLIDHHASPAGLQHRPLCTLGLAMLCDGTDPRDADGAPLPLAEALERVVAMPGAANPVRMAVEIALRQAGLPQREVRLELNSLTALVHAVAYGIGPVLAPRIPLADLHAPAGLRYRPVIGLEQALQVSLCTSKDMPTSLAAHAVQQALVGIVEERVRGDDWPRPAPSA
ncbi:MAG: LysR substrate-binding domain-containing protein [Pseudomonadota bacterium]